MPPTAVRFPSDDIAPEVPVVWQDDEWKAYVVRRMDRLERLASRAEKGGIATAAVLIGDVALERWLPKLIEHLPSILEAFK